ncbi:hypothetical protein NEOLEDRAFT_1097775 [Neolentinus lepideus HHB14362 ss-1]|uniref:GATA-type domain-containing protein n=1 Tax=Neolentinus lepideus HHB14362 ss-1 TaxID=1314782 RepID=A0A165QFM2_9AGAM|nr:hypothetical protein NEOLEDRAFT_1097775 [Neolentinus lepideus HHB14362 ss-1]
MSFSTPSQRGFESQAEMAPQLSHNNSRLNTSVPLQSFDDSFALLPQSAGSESVDQSSSPMPKVGETRCYWALLNAELQFLYLDPVLASHLGPQADELVGKPLLAFVHPDEQASARHDLGSVLDSRTLHGSVTRVRYSRLSSVRRQLGASDHVTSWTDAEKIAVDQNYMAVDIVINWAAEGLVLCFMHAVVDLTPYDNDPRYKTGWTNWCSTPAYAMDNQQISLMYNRLMHSVPQTGTMERVFQILLNQQGNRHCLISWPPDPASGQSDGVASKDFVRLAEEVQLGESPSGGASDAKTSCTRRYKALQPINVSGSDDVKEVESIFIPHGTIIFACHKVNPRPTATQMVYAPAPNGYPQQQQQQQYYNNSFSLPSISDSAAQYDGYVSQAQAQMQAHQPYNGQWSEASSSQTQQYYPPQQQTWASGSQPSAPMPYMEPPFQRPLSPSYQYVPSQEGASPSNMSTGSSSHANGNDANSSINDVVPPPRHASRRASPSTSTRDSYGGGGRSSGHPPVGIAKCSSCKATQSPEWRKGPSGKKDLCNACGLRYARSRAKKEGITSQRRRKAGAYGSAPSPASTASPSINSAVRRSGYADGPNAYGPPHGGSAHHLPSNINGMTPSPSPSPSTSMGFGQPYSRHPSQPSPTSSSFYSPVSPAGAMLSSSLNQGQNVHLAGASGVPRPRLNSLSSFPNSHSRLSISSSSPASASPISAPGYDRERERDRQSGQHMSLGSDSGPGMPLPPTPVSAGMEPQRHRV